MINDGQISFEKRVSEMNKKYDNLTFFSCFTTKIAVVAATI